MGNESNHYYHMAIMYHNVTLAQQVSLAVIGGGVVVESIEPRQISENKHTSNGSCCQLVRLNFDSKSASTQIQLSI